MAIQQQDTHKIIYKLAFQGNITGYELGIEIWID